MTKSNRLNMPSSYATPPLNPSSVPIKKTSTASGLEKAKPPVTQMGTELALEEAKRASEHSRANLLHFNPELMDISKNPAPMNLGKEAARKLIIESAQQLDDTQFQTKMENLKNYGDIEIDFSNLSQEKSHIILDALANERITKLNNLTLETFDPEVNIPFSQLTSAIDKISAHNPKLNLTLSVGDNIKIASSDTDEIIKLLSEPKYNLTNLGLAYTTIAPEDLTRIIHSIPNSQVTRLDLSKIVGDTQKPEAVKKFAEEIYAMLSNQHLKLTDLNLGTATSTMKG